MFLSFHVFLNRATRNGPHFSKRENEREVFMGLSSRKREIAGKVFIRSKDLGEQNFSLISG